MARLGVFVCTPKHVCKFRILRHVGHFCVSRDFRHFLSDDSKLGRFQQVRGEFSMLWKSGTSIGQNFWCRNASQPPFVVTPNNASYYLVAFFIFVDVGASISWITDGESRVLLGPFLRMMESGAAKAMGRPVGCLHEFSFKVHSSKNEFFFDCRCIIPIDKDNFISGVVSQYQ